jgi:hypothetical protein
LSNCIDINVNIKIPDDDYCNRCDFVTKIINLYSEPKCIIFKQKLKYVAFNKYEKCDKCKHIIKSQYKEEKENE